MKILNKFRENLWNFGVDSNITEGDGTEFGEPNRLILSTPNDLKNIHEIDTKIGNSWYFSNCSGIRLITYGTKLKNSDWFNYQFKLIDQESDPDLCWNWFTKVFNNEPDKELSEKVHIFGGKYTNLGRKILGDLVDVKNEYIFKVKTPKTQYTLIDPDTDELRDYMIVDITLPYPSNTEKMSLILQLCAQTQEISYSFRALTNTKMPDLIRLDKEKVIEEDNIEDLMLNWKELVKNMF